MWQAAYGIKQKELLRKIYFQNCFKPAIKYLVGGVKMKMGRVFLFRSVNKYSKFIAVFLDL